MPKVNVEMWEGRTSEQKRQLVEGIIASFENIGTPTEWVKVNIKEVPKPSEATGEELSSGK